MLLEKHDTTLFQLTVAWRTASWIKYQNWIHVTENITKATKWQYNCMSTASLNNFCRREPGFVQKFGGPYLHVGFPGFRMTHPTIIVQTWRRQIIYYKTAHTRTNRTHSPDLYHVEQHTHPNDRQIGIQKVARDALRHHLRKRLRSRLCKRAQARKCVCET